MGKKTAMELAKLNAQEIVRRMARVSESKHTISDILYYTAQYLEEYSTILLDNMEAE